jgi:hypothetical protein
VTCVFCGLNRLAGVEDVIPKWVRYALESTSSVTVQTDAGGAANPVGLEYTIVEVTCSLLVAA